MSLSKQLLILLSALFLMIFSVNFGLSVNNIKAYMEGEAQNHAQDTATSLGLSLSPYMANARDPLIKTMASAIFDMGYYSEIRLEDANHQTVFSLRNEKTVAGVPDWFVAVLPMKLANAQSEISSGWNISGVVYVTVNPSFAYSKLYQQAKTAFYYSIAAFIMAWLLLILLLRLTLAPLQRINQLALNIADGRFETLKNLPWTSEVKNVAVSMNNLSQKIQTTLNTLNGQLKTMGDHLLQDELTGLCKKAVFETDILQHPAEQSGAYLLLLKIDSLTELAKEQDREAIDRLLQAVAEQMRQATAHLPVADTRLYRFYGGEFALLLRNSDAEQTQSLANALSSALTALGKQYAKTDLAHIGISGVSGAGNPENLLESVYEAYEQACLIGPNQYYLREHTESARDQAAWKQLVFERIDQAAYHLVYRDPVNDLASHAVLMQEAFIEINDESGATLAIGPFISIAEKFAKIISLDKQVIEKTLQHIQTQGLQHAIAVNLSTRAIKNPEFGHWLETQLKTHATSAQQLIFSFSAYAIAKDVPSFVSFFYIARKLGGRVMIKRFETQSLSPELLKQLKPDYVRLARDLSQQLNLSQGKRDFVTGMQQLADLLDFSLLAENVRDNGDYQTLQQIGIRGASR